MSNDLRTLDLFAEANPVPDERVFESVDIEPAAYLATLQQRSSEVTKTDQQATQKDNRRQGWMIAAAAAAIVIVVGVLAIILNPGDDSPPPATDPAPPTTTSATTADATGYWVVDEVRRLALLEDGTYFWMSVGFVSDQGTWQQVAGELLTFRSSPDSQSCQENDQASIEFDMPDLDTLTVSFRSDDCNGERDIAPLFGTRTFTRTDPFEMPEALSESDTWDQITGWSDFSSGEVRSINFDVPYRFTASEGDGTVCLPHPDLDGWQSAAADEQNIDSALLITRRDPATLEATVTELQESLVDSGQPESTTVGGAPGVSFQGAPTADAGTYHDVISCTWTFSRGELWRFWVVDVNGSVVTFGLYGPADGFDTRIAEAEGMMATLEWRDLP